MVTIVGYADEASAEKGVNGWVIAKASSIYEFVLTVFDPQYDNIFLAYFKEDTGKLSFDVVMQEFGAVFDEAMGTWEFHGDILA